MLRTFSFEVSNHKFTLLHHYIVHVKRFMKWQTNLAVVSYSSVLILNPKLNEERKKKT